MVQEDKQLLFKDLCTRLPYGVKIQIYDDYSGMMKDEKLNVFHLDSTYSIEYRKLRPYLRPMDSMTEKEKQYVLNTWSEDDLNNGIDLMYDNYMMLGYASDFIDWLNEHHFDYRELIEKGLALEASEDMYKTE